MKRLAVMVTTPPHSNLTVSAIEYVEAALKQGVELIGVFFYQQGVLHANANVEIASDEFQAVKHWLRLNKEYALPLHLCVTAADKHGIYCDDTPSDRVNNLNSAFIVSGLGELVELTSSADRLIQF
ncbi:sulfurtransferase complex subunit TusD [Litorilituus sediminis]|uniref:Sulfurtransferase complex subunit TusD n=1 Tax=Litorilituus sediminis TaxID=718192 RepID=A0A4P6P119_9GAMM|nr:sulfurtransferase complex subunit TusD [Litorilituus sediminis]QBG34594.1 sulfurtransferase complex subunit TusD [Litorilituus sediminis]